MDETNDNSVRTSETFRTGMPARYRISLLLIGALAAIGTAASVATASLSGAVLAAALLMAVFIAVSLMRATVRLDEHETSIKVAGIFGTKIPYGTINDVTPGESTGLVAGMGLRTLQNRTTGYLVGGPSVRITMARTAVLVSSNTPEKLSAAIEDRRTQQVL